MDIELTPKELSAPDLKAIAQRVADYGGIESSAAIALLRHIEWQADEIERTRVRLDSYLDKAHGSPAATPVH